MARTVLINELEQMSSVLGSLAQFVACGRSPSGAELRTMLLEAQLEAEPELLTELRSWAHLLCQARDEGSKTTATVEALTQRGLPEASAVLATAAVTSFVAGKGVPTKPFDASGLVASVASLDFGMLPSGQVALGGIEVWGGPGRVITRSEQVKVSPEHFSSDPTRLNVRVEPLGPGLLWTELALVTPRETLEIPVLARWESAQPSHGESDLHPTFVVAPDGSGTHSSLVDALEAAPPGATVRLKRGVHYLKQGLLLQRPVTLVGDGMETTELVAHQGKYVLDYQSAGLFQLRDVTVRWAGPPSVVANVVAVRTGELRIESCRLVGAGSSGAHIAAGLLVSGTVVGSVRLCRMEGNGSGITIHGEAIPTLEDNTCRENNGHGIRYAGKSGGLAKSNTCSDNGYDGISIEDAASPLLENNTCHGNGWNGIGCCGRTDATVRRNSCKDNCHSGVHIREQAQPIVETNDCRENRDSGISYVGSSGGAAIDNRCFSNRKYGICITERSEPFLTTNHVQNNKDTGIAYFGRGTGTARRNTSSGNMHYGIFVGDEAHPLLEDNVCERNSSSGLAFFGNASGTALRNTCRSNCNWDIYINEPAHPVLKDNVYRQNRLSRLWSLIVRFGNKV